VKKPMKFFGRELSNTGSHWQLSMDKHVTVIVWSALAQSRNKKWGDDPPHLWYWHAKIVGVKPGNDFVVVRGRSPAEALRNLEKATLKAVRDFVQVFAVAFRQIGSDLLRLVHSTELPQDKKK
jgi:predicted ABC-class ATPase